MSWCCLRWTSAKLQKCVRRYTSFPALEPAFSFSHWAISSLPKISKDFPASLSLLPQQPFRPWLPGLCPHDTSKTSVMTPTWFSSRLRPSPQVSSNGSSPLVLSLHAGGPRILSSAVLSLSPPCLDGHIYPTVSTVIPDFSVQWSLLPGT